MNDNTAHIDATYETVSACCPRCGHQNVWNRAADLGTCELIDAMDVTCQNETCGGSIHLLGDLINPPFEMLIYGAWDLFRRKEYMQCVQRVAQAYEVFFGHFLRVQLLYRPSCGDDTAVGERFTEVSTALEKRIGRFTFEPMRNLVVKLIIEDWHPACLSDAEKLISQLPSVPPRISAEDVASLADLELRGLLVRLLDVKINLLRNRVVHKEAYRPTSADIHGELEEANHVIHGLTTRLRLQGDANWYVNGGDRRL